MERDTKLLWRIRPVMTEREIYTVRELHRRLKDVGYTISEVQLGRVRKALPKRLDTQLLAALCRVLEVAPGDLLVCKGQGSHRLPVIHKGPGEQQKVPSDEAPIQTPAASVIPKEFPLSGPKIGAMRVREPNP